MCQKLIAIIVKFGTDGITHDYIVIII